MGNRAYYEKNREQILLRLRERRRLNPEKNKEKCKAYYWKDPEKRKADARKWYHSAMKDPAKYKKICEQGVRASRKMRGLVLAHYGHKCSCCGTGEREFLSLDHINGGGRQHRKKLNQNIYAWLVRNNFPEGFRLLCHNCNQSMGLYGYCPHQRKSDTPPEAPKV